MLCITIGFTSCKSDDDNAYTPIEYTYEEGEEYLTGDLGVNSTSANAFGFEIDGLSFTEIGQFSTGNSLFNQNWVSSPASTTARDGLGPTFNARACASCHFKDGRGGPLVNGQNSDGFLMRISLPGQDTFGNPNPVNSYGNQIQDQANNNIPFEAKVNVSYEIIEGEYLDGTSYQLQKPIYTFSEEQFGSLAGVQTSPRVAQQTIGLGLVSALPDNEILQFADEFDANNDGISGKPNYVYDIESGTHILGKYGWKANMPSLKQQIAGAFSGDMGLTTSLFPENNCPSPQQDCIDAPTGGEPEVTDTQLDRVLFYQSTLAVPNRRNFTDESVLKGKVLFTELNCISCHAINQTTGSSDVHSILENVTIRPYSDFLLHDMGDDLADNRPDFEANGNEWRTQPLWGIGLISTVNDHTFFLHDGRARNIEEAILWHGGEAENSKNKFKNLTEEERTNLIDFVNSL
ncbi:di-heme oxidoredictase family protein [Oceanihabitans sp. 2_MG-2023]|uniref:di-heme oxidoreductase family protein n=1 Tax=Oceanihabitans sp. 2_MG-2023 TaxID=3062661 RepID=UPI0026E2E668|nr:di-heme oxidoredictase family protein [Oceanihabitans sp. 2_MG-2023]MDO6597109.1 di-heme oxidoredictase family protein [Oceanihabitans sp. 2_MG-2023]